MQFIPDCRITDQRPPASPQHCPHFNTWLLAQRGLPRHSLFCHRSAVRSQINKAVSFQLIELILNQELQGSPILRSSANSSEVSVCRHNSGWCLGKWGTPVLATYGTAKHVSSHRSSDQQRWSNDHSQSILLFIPPTAVNMNWQRNARCRVTRACRVQSRGCTIAETAAMPPCKPQPYPTVSHPEEASAQSCSSPRPVLPAVYCFQCFILQVLETKLQHPHSSSQCALCDLSAH